MAELNYNDLEIYLFRPEQNRYMVNLRFTDPDNPGDQPPVLRWTALVAEGDRQGQGEAPAEPLADQKSVSLSDLEMALFDPSAYGKLLTEALLFHPDAKTYLETARAVSEAANKDLRLRLYIDPEAQELHDLHWEAIQDPRDLSWLGANPRLPFSRFLTDPSWAAVRLRKRKELRALAVVANPKELESGKLKYAGTALAKVNVTGELQRAHGGLGGAAFVDDLASDPEKPVYVSLKAIENQLRQQQDGYDILYLVCHGDYLTRLDPPGPYLYLEGDDGSTALEPGVGLARLLKDLPDEMRPRLVALASCQSGGAASDAKGALARLGPLLAQAGVPAVLAMQGDITQESIALFIPKFFQTLRETGLVDLAAARGRVELENGQRSDRWMPVIYSRLRESQLFEQEGALPHVPAPAERKAFEPEMVYIPAGSFWMGRDPSPVAPPFETPMGRIELPAYSIGKYPVSNQEYAEYVRKTRAPVPVELGWDMRNPAKDQLNLPVRGVTWQEALNYCTWLSQQTGKNYSLPSEAQWEKAARGDNAWLYPWGETWKAERCNQGSSRLSAVGAYPAQSASGVYDLVGNVLQWTTTLWGGKRSQPEVLYPWRADDGRDSLEANSQVRRVLRGSAFSDLPADCTCTARRSYLPTDRGQPGKWHGFRVVIND